MTPQAPPPALLGAASPLTAPLLTGPDRPATVLARFSTAVYLHAGDHHDVLPLLAADALLLPTGLRLPLPAADLLWDVVAGDRVSIGRSGVRLPGWSIRVVRQWRPARVPVSAGRPAGHALLATAAAIAPHGLDLDLLDRAGELLHAALRGDGPGTVRLVRALVGSGRGLTPSGDDALCGVLLVLHGLGATSARRLVADAVAERRLTTTSLSASLLAAAAHGYAVPEVAALVTAALAGDHTAATAALEGVLAVGHSSGRDLAAGVTGCLRVLALLPAAVPPPVAPQPAGRDNP